MDAREEDVRRHQGGVVPGLTVQLRGLEIGFINLLVLLAHLSVDCRPDSGGSITYFQHLPRA